MKNTFLWTYSAKLDDKNRVVVPSSLRKCFSSNQAELFLLLAESPHWKYIKIIEDIFVSETINPLDCDSLELAKYKYFPLSMNKKNGRLQLKKELLEWLFQSNLDEIENRDLTFVWVINHIIITTKDITEVLK